MANGCKVCGRSTFFLFRDGRCGSCCNAQGPVEPATVLVFVSVAVSDEPGCPACDGFGPCECWQEEEGMQ